MPGPLLRPVLRPLPILGLSAIIAASGTLLATATKSFATTTTTTKTNMSKSTPWPITRFTPRHASWPYNTSDFTRQDSRPDPSFYSSPRFVTHIDDAAIADLRSYYDSVLPSRGSILDFCSSWVSHYPPRIEAGSAKGEVRVIGMGMNKAELDENQVLNGGRIVADLNSDGDVGQILRKNRAIGEGEDGMLDASTNVVSTDYLTQPVEVLRSLRAVTKQGGTVHLAISNRCFPTKAISRWLRVDEEERLAMVGDFLHFAGWTKIEIVQLSDGKIPGDGAQSQQPTQGGLQGMMAWMGMKSKDPLWVVRAVNE